MCRDLQQAMVATTPAVTELIVVCPPHLEQNVPILDQADDDFVQLLLQYISGSNSISGAKNPHLRKLSLRREIISRIHAADFSGRRGGVVGTFLMAVANGS